SSLTLVGSPLVFACASHSSRSSRSASAGARSRSSDARSGLARAVLLLSLLCANARAQVEREDAWTTDGPVHVIRHIGDRLYIGGAFSRIGPRSGGAVPLDLATGRAIEGFPRVRGNVLVIIPDGEGGWFIGGSFSAVGGVPRQNLAHVLPDLRLAAWAPHPP